MWCLWILLMTTFLILFYWVDVFSADGLCVLLQTSERIPRGTFCRIEHVLTSTWLHALQSKAYYWYLFLWWGPLHSGPADLVSVCVCLRLCVECLLFLLLLTFSHLSALVVLQLSISRTTPSLAQSHLLSSILPGPAHHRKRYILSHTKRTGNVHSFDR